MKPKFFCDKIKEWVIPWEVIYGVCKNLGDEKKNSHSPAKFGIKCNIQKAKDKFWLWIKSESIPRLVKLIRPYFIPSLLYKLPRND